MASEIEKKYRLTREEFERILGDLEDLEVPYEGEDTEENLIFSSESLMAESAVVRIRRTGKRTVLTYKKWMPDENGMKHHIEHETEVSDPDELRAIIEGLGVELSLVYEKIRKTWRVREAEVVLDELPFGLFMEIEGSPEAIREAEMILSAEDLAQEWETYPRLTQAHGVLNGRVREARFG